MAKTDHKAPFAYEGLDRVIHEKARLGILTSLVPHSKGLAFADLKHLCGLTDGNLSRHLQVLEEAKLVEVLKTFEGKRPLTTCRLTRVGRVRFLEYIAVLERVVKEAGGAAKSRGSSASRSAEACIEPTALFLTGNLAMQSILLEQSGPSLHVAIIMDGNGRWAVARGLPREAGHRAGVVALRDVVEAAPHLGITTLSAYAFSTENWRRPAVEVGALMAILRSYLQNELARLVKSGVRLTVLGRRDRLPDGIAELISHAEKATAGGGFLDLRLAIDYSGRDAIIEAVRRADASCNTRAEISRRLNARGGGPDVDLLIRTSGEQRLSDFMLWEAAYAELYFTETLWPDFDRAALERALRTFLARDRRYGGLLPPNTTSDDVSPAPVTTTTRPPRSFGSQIWTLLAGIAR